MAQTIRRGGKSVRRAAAASGTRRKMDTARKQTGTMIDTTVRWLPVSEDTLYRVLMMAILAGAAVLTWIVASMAGLPALAEAQLAVVAGQTGFEVKRVEVRGLNRMNELKIYEKVLSERDQAMSRLDLAALRTTLLDLPWVKDARVSRQLPDTLVVDVVEREPHAVLRTGDKFTLIDNTGHPLEAVSEKRARGMLVLTGDGAGARSKDLGALLEAAPALKPQVAQAEWIGHRRWNLTFKTGQILALPEGADTAAAALLTFARMDGVDRLIGGKVASFDMRARDRTYMLVPGRAAAAGARQQEIADAKAAQAKVATSKTRSESPSGKAAKDQ
ncbi:FtsQ-type POTRA domain-containing protein [Novosphingobium sp. Chol11]|uniref:cell division protein FtsQ/DivIB n=1 Tax=Novosphingobium sp. Chol11 TaxID=1385763 RepID=UPI0025E871C9|nr:FtsQ-type POTRA domain-containing protein [Novosphingobium sp. Chol11]